MKNMFLYVDNDNEDSAVFPADSLSVIEAGDQVVNIYFGQHEKKHKVVLACADDESELVAATIARELAKRFANPALYNMVTIADDTNSAYITDGVSATLAGGGITGVTSITVDAD